EGVTVGGVGNLLTSIARCCRPVPGDPIIGYITRGRGITIHRRDCPNVRRLVDRERLIAVNWEDNEKQTYPVLTCIRAYDRQGLMRDISEVIANEQINITDVNVHVNTKNRLANVWVTMEVTDLPQLKKVMDKIEQLPNVIEVSRKR
ncbi:MAG: bifunctional (p)ppGpp synthetase/guanosine-3',5'-bis(diphosphate) 3'-pyrophosphohydrolase, partial [Caldilineae bacterium]